MGAFRSIKQWPSLERPRERLIAKGSSVLSDAQLMAILLQTGRAGTSALGLALDLLKKFGDLSSMAAVGSSELCAVSGIGPAKAAKLLAAFEVGRRSLVRALRKGEKVRSSQDIFLHYHPLLKDMKKEVFMVLLLDSKHRVVKDLMVSTGSINLNIVHPREVFHPAVRESAVAVILLHNHPSGDPTPSPEDRQLTDRLVNAGQIMGITVLDHLVFGDQSYVSFADRGWLVAARPDRGSHTV
jgi:DNA repair protein RadC